MSKRELERRVARLERCGEYGPRECPACAAAAVGQDMVLGADEAVDGPLTDVLLVWRPDLGEVEPEPPPARARCGAAPNYLIIKEVVVISVRGGNFPEPQKRSAEVRRCWPAGHGPTETTPTAAAPPARCRPSEGRAALGSRVLAPVDLLTRRFTTYDAVTHNAGGSAGGAAFSASACFDT